jgi:hypothetical protein
MSTVINIAHFYERYKLSIEIRTRTCHYQKILKNYSKKIFEIANVSINSANSELNTELVPNSMKL